MQFTADISTIELSRTRLRLRDDVRAMPQVWGDKGWCHLEVRESSRYYRIGWSEYVFLSLLDGRTSFAEALAVSSQSLGDKALGQPQATQFYSWLLEQRLATLTDSDARSSGATSATRGEPTAAWWKKLNPLWMRIPLGRPDFALQQLSPSCGWLVSPAANLITLLLTIVSCLVLWSRSERFMADASGIIAADNWLWLAVAGIALKIVHELAHGLVCLRYGGTVREAGIVLAMLTPLAYVDASSAWSFRSRWQRIHTAVAGVQIELLLASLATLAWLYSSDPFVRQLLQNVIVMASISTIVFNLNPLMKFDGYFVLSDLLQIPNLSSEASSELQSAVRAFFLGSSRSQHRLAGWHRRVALAYGVAATCWRLMVSLSLLLTASVLAHGAGLILAIIGLVMWFGRPVIGAVKHVWILRVQAPERLLRAGLVSVLLVSIATASTLWLPAPVLTNAPGVIEFTDADVVRAISEGFVDAVFVEDGASVKAGQSLLKLSNLEIDNELASVMRRLEQETLKMQSAASGRDDAGASIASGNLLSLRKQVEECQRRFDALTLRANRDGVVTARSLSQLPGTWLAAGTEVLTIGDPEHKELRISVSQQDLESATRLVGESVRLRVGTLPTLTGVLVRVDPQASRELSLPALGATNGGPLAVAESESRDDSGAASVRLTEHRFTAIVSLPEEDSAAVFCGQRGQASLGLVNATLGQHVHRSARDWINRQLGRFVPARD